MKAFVYSLAFLLIVSTFAEARLFSRFRSRRGASSCGASAPASTGAASSCIGGVCNVR